MMIDKKIIIINYGINNLKSINMALQSLNYKTIITSDKRELTNADRIILPGVGSFKSGMKSLSKIKIIDQLYKSSLNNIPILGICLGMQLFMTESQEFGLNKGLNLISGTVKKIPKINGNNYRKIPHIGWNKLNTDNISNNWSNSILSNLSKNSYFYFVHSYSAYPDNNNEILSFTNYNNLNFVSSIMKNNIVGLQFHPEKSGKIGLNILKNFVS